MKKEKLLLSLLIILSVFIGSVTLGIAASGDQPKGKPFQALWDAIDDLQDQIDDIQLSGWTDDGTVVRLTTSTDKVGIGTASPGAKLDVRGDIKLGSAGELFAASGVENLKIVRGVVDRDGTIKRGTGFTITKTGIGRYQITFTTPFGGYPTTTASIDDAEYPAGLIRIIHFSLNDRIDISTMSDYDPNTGSGVLGDRGFSFIAVGPR